MNEQIASQLQQYVDNINAACAELGKAENPFKGVAMQIEAAYIEACKVAIETFVKTWMGKS